MNEGVILPSPTRVRKVSGKSLTTIKFSSTLSQQMWECRTRNVMNIRQTEVAMQRNQKMALFHD